MAEMNVSVQRSPRAHHLQADDELVALARLGDDEAVRVLVRRFNRQLFRLARGVLRDDAEAEDALQAAYARAFTRLEGFRGESALSTWLGRIVLNEALGRRRGRRPVVSLDDFANGHSEAEILMFPIVPSVPDPESAFGRAEVRRILERSVDRLPDPFRLVFILREVEGLSVEETAASLELKPDTVKTRLHRARKLLRSDMERTLSATFSELFPFDGDRCVNMAERVLRTMRSIASFE